ncbi:MAG: class I SAM-dependent methyltransferase [Propionibacteriaceae bacterium]|nr:class I SAM-dependent methyltransferase [Propionibacteriaceae bacterium]
MVRARSVVDLGTGGGERLLCLIEGVDASEKRVVATEGWKPNIPIARQALSASGIDVVDYDADCGEAMPFSDASVDLVMSRHEAIDPQEIARVLTPGGWLLTQQVDGRDAEEIHEWFGEDFAYPHVTADRYADDLTAAGLRVHVKDEWIGTMEFADATALVAYIAMVPWDAPHFTVDDHVERLTALDEDRPIHVTQRRFRIYATKLSSG